MDLEIIAFLISVVLAIVALWFGTAWTKVKSLLREISQALNETSNAIEDNNLTKEELKRIIAQWRDVIELAREIAKK